MTATQKRKQLQPTVHALIVQFREQNSYTLRQIGKEFGVSAQGVMNWENGVSEPRDEAFLRVLETSTTPWARSLAQQCLALRYPKVFSQLA